MLDALSADPSAHIGSLEEGISSTPLSQATKTCTTIQGERIQALNKEIPTNVQFPQPKPKKRYGSASI